MKFLILSIFFLSFNSSAQSGYVCLADSSTGFAFNSNTKTWNPTSFNVKDSKYLLSLNNGKWEWKRFGEKYGIPCSSNFNEKGYLRCDSIEEVSFNKVNLRYLLVYPIGYVNGGIAGKEGADTPSMEIGKCSPM